MIERANTTTVDIVIIGIGTYAESADNWMSQIECLDVADDYQDIYYVTEFEAGDFNAHRGIIRNYTCNGENPASDGDRGGAPWVYEDGSTGLGPIPTAVAGGGVADDTPAPVAAAAAVSARTGDDKSSGVHRYSARSSGNHGHRSAARSSTKKQRASGKSAQIDLVAEDPAADGGDVTFFSWIGEGAQFFVIPDQLSTSTVVMVAMVIFVAVAVFRRYSRNKKRAQKSYKKVVFNDGVASDSESDLEAAQPMNK